MVNFGHPSTLLDTRRTRADNAPMKCQLTVRCHMPRFKVKCYERGKWDEIEHRDIEAQDQHEAAVRICGGPLIGEAGQPGQLRAQVWPVSKPGARKMFYIPARLISN